MHGLQSGRCKVAFLLRP